MKITWLGHAAFGIEVAGARILTDPYSSEIGFAPINEAFDIVTLSHQNPQYHSCLDEVLGTPEIIDGLELARSGEVLRRGEVRFGAVEVAEDEAGNGPNAMVWIESQGVRVLHMGDCGHQPTPAQVAACGQVEVLLALAGDRPTLSIQALLNFVEALGRRRMPLVVPMHYAVPQLKTLSLQPVEVVRDCFIVRFGRGCVQRAPEPTIAPLSLGEPFAPTLLIVPPAR